MNRLMHLYLWNAARYGFSLHLLQAHPSAAFFFSSWQHLSTLHHHLNHQMKYPHIPPMTDRYTISDAVKVEMLRKKKERVAYTQSTDINTFEINVWAIEPKETTSIILLYIYIIHMCVCVCNQT